MIEFLKWGKSRIFSKLITDGSVKTELMCLLSILYKGTLSPAFYINTGEKEQNTQY